MSRKFIKSRPNHSKNPATAVNKQQANLEKENDEEEYGIVLKINGASVNVLCADQVERICSIPGKMKIGKKHPSKKLEEKISWVLVQKEPHNILNKDKNGNQREYGRILGKIPDDQVKQMKKDGKLDYANDLLASESTQTNGVDDGGFDFEDI